MDEDNLEREAQQQFERQFEELVDALQFLVEKVEETPAENFSQDINEKISNLENDVKNFCEIVEGQLPEANKSYKDLEELTSNEKACLRRARGLLDKIEKKKDPNEKPIENEAFKKTRKPFKNINKRKV